MVEVDPIFAVYTILLVGDRDTRVKSKSPRIHRLEYIESHTLLGMNRYVIWKTRISAAALVDRAGVFLGSQEIVAIQLKPHKP